MSKLTRRSVLHASLGLAAAGTLARPYIANAAATTATAWFAQGFVETEDIALRKVVADYAKASGNTIDLSVVPFAPIKQKIISALTSGVVPDVIDATGINVAAEQAWTGALVDVSDVVETQKAHMMPSALLGARCYDNVAKRRSFYGVPYKCSVRPFHIWGSLVEKAGYQRSDIPKTWDAFIDFFKPVQQKLRDQGARHVYATGFVLSTVGDDINNTVDQFLMAYGGEGIVTQDGKLHSDDPKVKEAVLKTLAKLSSLFREGYVPPGTVNWNDADDNNAFHSQQVVMDLDGTLSTEIAMLKNQKDAYYHDVMCLGMPLSNAGKPVPSVFSVNLAFIPKGAKNIEVGKEFIKYLIQPEVSGKYTKDGGRYLPVFPQIIKDDPWWTDLKQDPHRPNYVHQAFDNPTLPAFYVYNPAYSEVQTEHVWGVALADCMTGGMTPEAAAAKAWQRIEALFAKYPIKET